MFFLSDFFFVSEILRKEHIYSSYNYVTCNNVKVFFFIWVLAVIPTYVQETSTVIRYIYYLEYF